MNYKLKEIYYTLQGEGYHTGRPALFCRFTGCNLWSGREEDRADAICSFCDTDFWGMDGEHGGRYSADALVELFDSLWPQANESSKFIVFTGGEPALQLDDHLIDACHRAGYQIAVETNGTLPLPNGIDWLCVSPKADTEIIIQKGNELKLVYPQAEHIPSDYNQMDFDHFYLQAMDGPDIEHNLKSTIQYCLENPEWKLSLQTHKSLGLK